MNFLKKALQKMQKEKFKNFLTISFLLTILVLVCYVYVQRKMKYNNTMIDMNELDVHYFQRLILPQSYATVNQVKDPQLMNYRAKKLYYGNYSDYKYGKELGSGASGVAYLAYKISTKQKVVIKEFLDDVRILGIKKEIMLQRAVQDHPKVVEIIDILNHKGIMSLVYPFYPNKPSSNQFRRLNNDGIAYYIYSTLQVLDFAHSRGIIHADVKPLNMLVNPETYLYKMIDWGLGTFYFPGRAYSVRVGTKTYKAPELFLNYHYYDYSIDIFSTGMVFSKLLFRNGPLYPDVDIDNWTSKDFIDKYAKVLGTQAFLNYIKKFKIDLNWYEEGLKYYEKQPWENYINDENEQYCSPLAFDLLDKMLTVDHSLRISAKDAMNHPYFDDIRYEDEL